MTGIQALERASPTLKMRPSVLERPEYEYIRHGTQCLLAGLDVATGEVLVFSNSIVRKMILLRL